MERIIPNLLFNLLFFYKGMKILQTVKCFLPRVLHFEDPFLSRFSYLYTNVLHFIEIFKYVCHESLEQLFKL